MASYEQQESAVLLPLRHHQKGKGIEEVFPGRSPQRSALVDEVTVEVGRLGKGLLFLLLAW